MRRCALIAAAVAAMCAAMCGCIYKGAKVVEGTDLAIGVTVPQADGVAQLDVLNYLSGFRLGVAENAALTVKYSVAETNSYFGCITTRTWKTIDATVEPCETTSAETCETTSPARATGQLKRKPDENTHDANHVHSLKEDTTGTAGED